MNKTGNLSDLQLAFNFSINGIGCIYQAYLFDEDSVVLVKTADSRYDKWSIYKKSDVIESFDNKTYTSDFGKASIRAILTGSIEHTGKITGLSTPLDKVLEITKISKVRVAIFDGVFEVYADCLADTVKISTEERLLEILDTILKLEKIYAK